MARFDWEDSLSVKNALTPEELDIQETARAYCQERLLPRVLGKLCLASLQNQAPGSDLFRIQMRTAAKTTTPTS